MKSGTTAGPDDIPVVWRDEELRNETCMNVSETGKAAKIKFKYLG